MPTFLLTWNPAIWDGVITDPIDWSCGNTKRIKAGNRLFLIRQGAVYGSLAEKIIHVHHLRPLSQIAEVWQRISR